MVSHGSCSSAIAGCRMRSRAAPRLVTGVAPAQPRRTREEADIPVLSQQTAMAASAAKPQYCHCPPAVKACISRDSSLVLRGIGKSAVGRRGPCPGASPCSRLLRRSVQQEEPLLLADAGHVCLAMKVSRKEKSLSVVSSGFPGFPGLPQSSS